MRPPSHRLVLSRCVVGVDVRHPVRSAIPHHFPTSCVCGSWYLHVASAFSFPTMPRAPLCGPHRVRQKTATTPTPIFLVSSSATHPARTTVPHHFPSLCTPQPWCRHVATYISSLMMHPGAHRSQGLASAWPRRRRRRQVKPAWQNQVGPATLHVPPSLATFPPSAPLNLGADT
jgi:hypothetical protein